MKTMKFVIDVTSGVKRGRKGPGERMNELMDRINDALLKDKMVQTVDIRIVEVEKKDEDE